MRFLDAKPFERIVIPAGHGTESTVHVFTEEMILAVNTAIACGRPLLVRGEPGTGKSQLARAVAQQLGRPFIQKVFDIHTEVSALFWDFDAVARLALAQMAGALAHTGDRAEVGRNLAAINFLKPGPLWWAFDWAGACRQAIRSHGLPAGTETVSLAAVEPPHPKGWSVEMGVVVLLDEIDKADGSIPNGLLEALGNGVFEVPHAGRVAITKTSPPLTFVTTNEERELPDAFLRRCVVLQLSTPHERAALIGFLVKIGSAHFPKVKESVLKKAAEILASDREEIRRRGLNPPGLAEYLDLVRAVTNLEHEHVVKQLDALVRISRYVLRKHPGDQDP